MTSQPGRSDLFESPTEAEEAFYDAFSSADADAMMRVWAHSVDVVCIHPSGPRLEGILEIRRSWKLIFEDRVRRQFTLRSRRIIGSDDIRVHLLEESIAVPGAVLASAPVMATNIYQRLQDGWYMVLHHASLAPAGVPYDIEESDVTNKPEPPIIH